MWRYHWAQFLHWGSHRKHRLTLVQKLSRHKQNLSLGFGLFNFVFQSIWLDRIFLKLLLTKVVNSVALEYKLCKTSLLGTGLPVLSPDNGWSGTLSSYNLFRHFYHCVNKGCKICWATNGGFLLFFILNLCNNWFLHHPRFEERCILKTPMTSWVCRGVSSPPLNNSTEIVGPYISL